MWHSNYLNFAAHNGRLLYSDIAAIRKRIITTHKLNIVNLGARFLYFFFQSFKAIVWIDHNDKVSTWESLYNISKHQKTKNRPTVSTSHFLTTTSLTNTSLPHSATNKDSRN